jgi:hypothetical protein
VRHPPYPLRPNKAIDRYMLVEALKLVGRPADLRAYTYYSFGGPFLDDLKLLHDHFPDIHMISFELDEQTFRRQRFHLPCSRVSLRKQEFGSFLAQNEVRTNKSVFWLDYTGLEFADVEQFSELLQRVADRSVVKITLRAEVSDFVVKDAAEEFRRKFERVLPDPSTLPPATSSQLAALIQTMLQIAAEQSLPTASGQVFQPIYSAYYSDKTGMFSLCGIVCARRDRGEIRSMFRTHPFANLDWQPPLLLDAPFLSTKERLRLQRHLPCRPKTAGKRLTKALGYWIDDTEVMSESRLREYAAFYRYYPYFIRAVP